MECRAESDESKIPSMSHQYSRFWARTEIRLSPFVCPQQLVRILLGSFAFTCAFLIAINCGADPGSLGQRKAVLAGLNKMSPNGRIASWKVNVLNVSGDWAFADVTPLDKAGHALAEQKVAVLHHLHGRDGSDGGW